MAVRTSTKQAQRRRRQPRECPSCRHEAELQDLHRSRGQYAPAIDAHNRAHTADIVTGRTLCGRDATRWTWVTIAPATSSTPATR